MSVSSQVLLYVLPHFCLSFVYLYTVCAGCGCGCLLELGGNRGKAGCPLDTLPSMGLQVHQPLTPPRHGMLQGAPEGWLGGSRGVSRPLQAAGCSVTILCFLPSPKLRVSFVTYCCKGNIILELTSDRSVGLWPPAGLVCLGLQRGWGRGLSNG